MYKNLNMKILKAKSRSNIKNFDLEFEKSYKSIQDKFNENPDCTPIFIAVVGSLSYGLDLAESDIDIKGIYIQDLDSILQEPNMGIGNPLIYKPQIGGSKKGTREKKKEDITLYELGRFMDLLKDNNPNILELLNTPEDCIIYKHELWDSLIRELGNNILTKKCYYSFFNYANSQIRKATGLNKKINNPMSKIRKSPLDFCHVIIKEKAIPLRKYLDNHNLDQVFCGLISIPHARGLYGIYYDQNSANIFSKKYRKNNRDQLKQQRIDNNLPMGLGYQGIIKEVENQEISNDLKCSSIPLGEDLLFTITYNKDGYVEYCKDYREYWGKDGWMEKRNNQRYNDNISHGQNYDSKNMSHCVRLLTMAREIAEGKGIIVIRHDRDFLLEIKKGKSTYDEIVTYADKLTTDLKEVYDNSNLPEEVDIQFIQSLLLKYRKQFYGI